MFLMIQNVNISKTRTLAIHCLSQFRACHNTASFCSACDILLNLHLIDHSL